jgi:hypothetical protein
MHGIGLSNGGGRGERFFAPTVGMHGIGLSNGGGRGERFFAPTVGMQVANHAKERF